MNLLVSCISTKHSTLKKHWADTGQQLACPLTVRGSLQKPNEDLGGLLSLVVDGKIERTLPLSMAAGMVPSDEGVLVTTATSIHEVDPLLRELRRDVISLPLFNALHSISRSARGYLVASTGLDLVVEVSREGEVLWQWWATDHGFAHTPTGALRQLDKARDHRQEKYGTLSQTTHVNSVAEHPTGIILASLFHQGMVIAIDRESGAWQPVLEGLDHPHSVRILDAEHFTVADTVGGRALLARLTHPSSRASIEAVVDADTDWLQDCSYEPRSQTWVLVDGKRSRVVLRAGNSGTAELTTIQFDPEWRLYEALVLQEVARESQPSLTGASTQA
ncbi:hypothetical protein [Thermogemmatispora onikobensis]|uniref:hypothetical protein n=1 Tax=Thermogemmatispora onikobensis TaxID=732234 RepID=UPI000853C5A0|nr:hypothetical protein [Thermogemmatispora onikobensis]